MKNTTFVQYHESDDDGYNVFDIFQNSVKVGYFYEYFVHPETGEKFDSPVYEVYYDNTSDDPEYCSRVLDQIRTEVKLISERK
jgi:hypothetical protein